MSEMNQNNARIFGSFAISLYSLIHRYWFMMEHDLYMKSNIGSLQYSESDYFDINWVSLKLRLCVQ